MQCTEEVAYEGETGSNGYSRGKEHQNALVLKQEENALWKHCLVAHAGERVEFSMEVIGNFHSCLVRQVNEGVRIKRSKAKLSSTSILGSESCQQGDFRTSLGSWQVAEGEEDSRSMSLEQTNFLYLDFHFRFVWFVIFVTLRSIVV